MYYFCQKESCSHGNKHNDEIFIGNKINEPKQKRKKKKTVHTFIGGILNWLHKCLVKCKPKNKKNIHQSIKGHNEQFEKIKFEVKEAHEEHHHRGNERTDNG